LKEHLYLRVNPEPDVWQIASEHKNFFWVGSMFRDEKKLGPNHKYEFKVVDIYQKGNIEDVRSLFFEILNNLENNLNIGYLSKKFIDIKYHVGVENAEIDEGWVFLTNYPIDESFYDPISEDGISTKKFEIFYKRGGEVLEVAACGELGDNLNKKRFIDDTSFINKKSFDDGLVGFGIGIERLMSLYR
jgi:elongation factor P--beta-lysine ligase